MYMHMSPCCIITILNITQNALDWTELSTIHHITTMRHNAQSSDIPYNSVKSSNSKPGYYKTA